MTRQPDNPVARDVGAALAAAGFDAPTLVETVYSPESFGNGIADFDLGWCTLRCVRDRNEEFVDLAFGSEPATFYTEVDVGLALGWHGLDDVLQWTSPEPLASVLERLQHHRPRLESAFTPAREAVTRAAIERAAQVRGEAFASLRGRT